jgi:hypothetical protein
MSYEPIISLLHKNHREAGRLRNQLALSIAQEIIEAYCQHGRQVDHHEQPSVLIPTSICAATSRMTQGKCVTPARDAPYAR